jgi:RNA polymerase sigma factor (sigma-70 family)
LIAVANRAPGVCFGSVRPSAILLRSRRAKGTFFQGGPLIDPTHAKMDPAYTFDIASETRWSVDDASSRNQRLSQRTKTSFPARCDPLDPTAKGQQSTHREKQGDRRYPPTCNPNRARQPLTKEQQELATQNHSLARALARRMRYAWPGAQDEFESAALLALVEAAQAFDPTRGVKFTTFAHHRISGALRDLKRELYSHGGRGDVASRRAGTGFHDVQSLGIDSEAHGHLIGAEADEPVGTELENLDTIENWIRQLPRPHALAFRHIYLDGKSKEETARLVGCSKAYLTRLHQQAITWLHEAYVIELND